MEGTILGKLVSKANSRRAVPGRTKTGKTFNRYIKSESALDFEQSALWQLKKIVGNKKPLQGELALEVTVFYESRRPDLDISLLCDVLEKAGVYENDRQIHQIVATKMYDKENPRCEFIVYEM
jgi:Holliday junction resolvase RusA-like endonuclease